MSIDARLHIRFWGVRGSIHTPAAENLGYGGNTPCIEIRAGNEIFVIDGGSGARNLGYALEQEFGGNRCCIDMLMTHFHWDHIHGLPFFAPLFSPLNEVTFHSSRPPEEVRQIMEGQMMKPFFPVKFELLAAKRRFLEMTDEPFRRGGLSIHSFPLHHPQGATGYRLEKDGAVAVHASDFEHGDPRLDLILREYARDADVLIMDAQYTPEEYSSKRGWGHSTWLEATNVARDSGVKQLVLFHHDPGHSDAFLDDVVRQARRHFDNTVAAREGWAISL